jgi:hypothetical protein
MPENKYKIHKKASKGESLFSVMERMLRMDQLFDEGVPTKYLPNIFFIIILGVFYIGNTHWVERTVRKIDKLQTEVDELRADYTSLKADYMFASKQSEVAKKVKSKGLRESKTPPYKIIIHKGEY